MKHFLLFCSLLPLFCGFTAATPTHKDLANRRPQVEAAVAVYQRGGYTRRRRSSRRCPVTTSAALIASAPSSITTTKSSATTTKPVLQQTKHTTSHPSAPTTTSGSSSGSSSGGSSAPSGDEAIYLKQHNDFRAQHGAAPLKWNDNLAAKAQQWANNCVFQHSGGTLGPFGENLAAGVGGGYDIVAAIKSWTDEASSYNPNQPDPSHFTQVVWKSSTELGCAKTTCSNIFDASKFGNQQLFVVCEYSPAGNVIGEFPQNVQV